ncbi:MAG: tetratricopeptide repeat protein [Candidatus Poribacteria bacterium]|nr:tetratricopeptide repeat protein [Candidatus Poribacteria bacterium]
MQTERQSDTSALAEYDEAIRINPNSAEAYFNRGLARASLDQDPSAIADYDAAIRLNPDVAEAYFHRACLRDYLAPRESVMVARHATLRSAITDFDEAIRIGLDPSLLPHAYYRRGKAKYNLNRYEAAIVDFDEALRLNPNDPESLDGRKDAEGILNFYEEGITHFDEIIHQNPNDIRTYKTRGETNGFLGRMQEAKVDFQKILELAIDTDIIAETEKHLQELGNPDYWQQYSWHVQ